MAPAAWQALDRHASVGGIILRFSEVAVSSQTGAHRVHDWARASRSVGLVISVSCSAPVSVAQYQPRTFPNASPDVLTGTLTRRFHEAALVAHAASGASSARVISSEEGVVRAVLECDLTGLCRDAAAFYMGLEGQYSAALGDKRRTHRPKLEKIEVVRAWNRAGHTDFD